MSFSLANHSWQSYEFEHLLWVLGALPSSWVNLLLTVSSHPKTLDRPPWLGWEDSYSELEEIKITKIHWLRKRLTMVIEIKTTCDCRCQLQQYSSHLETEPTPFEFWHQFQYFYRSFWIGLLLSKFIGVARRRIYETIKLSFYFCQIHNDERF